MEKLVEWELGKETELLGKKSAPFPLDPLQILYELTWDQTRAAAVGSRRLFAWAMTQPSLRLTANHKGKDRRTEEITKRIYYSINRQDSLLLTTLYPDVASRPFCGKKSESGKLYELQCSSWRLSHEMSTHLHVAKPFHKATLPTAWTPVLYSRNITVSFRLDKTCV